MSILTSKQLLELHTAILQYLLPLLESKPDTLQVVAQALDASPDTDTTPNYLEKKWATVLRLQKRILDLENEVAAYKTLVAANSQGGHVLPRNKLEWVPTSVSEDLPTGAAQVPNCVTIHPFLPQIVVGCADGSVLSWDLAADPAQGPHKKWQGHTRAVHRAVWSPTRATVGPYTDFMLATCSLDMSVKVYAGDTLAHVRTLTGHEHTVSGVAFSAYLNTLYSVSRDTTIKAWDIDKGHCIRSFVGHSDWVRDIDVSAPPTTVKAAANGHKTPSDNLLSFTRPEGDFLLTASSDQSVRLSHSLGTGLAMLIGHTHVVETAKFLPMAACKHIDAHVLRHLDKFAHLSALVLKSGLYDALGFKYVVSASRDNSVKLWLLPPPLIQSNRPPLPSDLNNAQGWHVLDLVGHQSWVRAIDVHPTGRFIMSASDDRTIRVWDLASLTNQSTVACTRTLDAHAGFVNSIHFARFESKERTEAALQKAMRCLFVSAGTDNRVRLWS